MSIVLGAIVAATYLLVLARSEAVNLIYEGIVGTLGIVLFFLVLFAVVFVYQLFLAPRKLEQQKEVDYLATISTKDGEIKSLNSKYNELLEKQKAKLEIVIPNEPTKTHTKSDRDNTRTFYRIAVRNTGILEPVEGIEVRLLKVIPIPLTVVGAQLNFMNEPPGELRATQDKWVEVIVLVKYKQDLPDKMMFFLNSEGARNLYPLQECTLTIEASGKNTSTVTRDFRFHSSQDTGEYILELIPD